MKSVMMVVALVATGASAAETVQQFLDAAEQQNVDQKISIEQRNRAAAEFRQAWTAMLPSLTAQGAYTHNQYNAEITINPITMEKVVIIPYDQFDAALRIDLPIIDTTRWFRAMSADLASQSATLREQVTRDLIRRQVVAAYYGYAAALAVRESAKKSAGVAVAQLKLMEIRASAGTVTELEVLRSKAEVARTRQLIADSDSLVATTRRALRTLSGLEPSEEIAQPLDDTRPVAPLEELEARIENLPAVQAADKDREAANRVATSARLALVPTVGGQFTQRFTNATGFQGKAATYVAGINLTWRLDAPTFMGWGAQDANEAAAALGADRARLVARDQVNSDWQRLNAALIKIDAAKAQVEAAQRAAQVAKDRYAAGAATQVEVILAERDVFTAEVSQIQARTELATARASLNISAALPLE
ncbi:MAG: TolC family protein [Myxococcota bacterium]